MGKFKTEEEVIELANNTSYGLAAGLHSSGSRICLSDAVSPERKLDHVPPPFRGPGPMHARFVCSGGRDCK